METIDLNTLAADLATLKARVEALEAASAAKTAPVAPKAVTPRKAGESITFLATNPLPTTKVEGRVYEALKGQTLTRAEAIKLIEEGKYSARPANVMLYDVLVAADKVLKAAQPAQAAPTVTPAPVVEETKAEPVVAPQAAETAPLAEVLDLPVEPVVEAAPKAEETTETTTQGRLLDLPAPKAETKAKGKGGKRANG